MGLPSNVHKWIKRAQTIYSWTTTATKIKKGQRHKSGCTFFLLRFSASIVLWVFCGWVWVQHSTEFCWMLAYPPQNPAEDGTWGQRHSFKIQFQFSHWAPSPPPPPFIWPFRSREQRNNVVLSTAKHIQQKKLLRFIFVVAGGCCMFFFSSLYICLLFQQTRWERP